MKIAIAGGTGFVGKALVKELTKNGHQVIVLTRKANQDGPVQYVQWLHPNSNPATLMAGTDVIINLAGESINSGRWTEHRKKTILNSRLEAVHELLTIMNELNPKPKAFINASAVGYYGTSLDKTFSEDNKGSGDDFLSRTVMEWEKKPQKQPKLGYDPFFADLASSLIKKKVPCQKSHSLINHLLAGQSAQESSGCHGFILKTLLKPYSLSSKMKPFKVRSTLRPQILSP